MKTAIVLGFLLACAPVARAQDRMLGLLSLPEVFGNFRIVEFRRVGDQLWVHVEVFSHSLCGSTGEPSVAARGCVPAHAPSGEATIWFFSRGC